jgi:hypothetical protein
MTNIWTQMSPNLGTLFCLSKLEVDILCKVWGKMVLLLECCCGLPSSRSIVHSCPNLNLGVEFAMIQFNYEITNLRFIKIDSYNYYNSQT